MGVSYGHDSGFSFCAPWGRVSWEPHGWPALARGVPLWRGSTWTQVGSKGAVHCLTQTHERKQAPLGGLLSVACGAGYTKASTSTVFFPARLRYSVLIASLPMTFLM